MNLEKRIKSLAALGNILLQFTQNKNINSPTHLEIEEIISSAESKNPWFTKENTLYTLKHWGKLLSQENIHEWLSKYEINYKKNKTIGLILAGNIPMVGFHDCISVLLIGYKAKIKLSSKDNVLIPYFLNLWKEFNDELEYEFVEKLTDYDAVITTGSNNTAKYFEYYFKDIPHIIRKNKTSVAILDGNETEEEMIKLGKDVFTYFGLGCRSVTQILIPEDYDLEKIFSSFLSFQEVINHNKYANNYDYNRAVYLLNKDNFWDNNFMLLKESDELYSPIAVLYFKRYKNLEDAERFIRGNVKKIQCVISNINFEHLFPQPLGEAQNPKINIYADGVDTLKFLVSI